MSGIIAAHQAARKINRFSIATLRQPIHKWTTGVPQPQQTCHFVVGFARGVVKCGPQFLHRCTHPVHLKQLCVPTRHQQCHSVRQGLTFQVRHSNMPTQVIHAIKRHVPRRRIRLRRAGPHQQRTRQTRSNCRCHNIRLIDARFRKRRPHHRPHRLKVRS